MLAEQVKPSIRETFSSLAELIQYPIFDHQHADEGYKQFKEKIDNLISILSLDSNNKEAGTFLVKFRESLNKLEPWQLEEVYSTTFDMSPTCYIYAGFLLFGESNKRLEFLVKLKEKFKQFQFKESDELPDHIGVLIEFLAQIGDSEILFKEILEDCLIPAVTIMRESFTKVSTDKKPIDVSSYYDNDRNPYFYLISMIEQYFLTLVPEDYVAIEVSPEKADFDPEELYQDQNESVCGGCSVPKKAMNMGSRPPFIKYKEKKEKSGFGRNGTKNILEGEIK